MKTLAILGASGHGKVVADTALCAGWKEVIFFDDRWPDIECIGPWRVMGNSESLITHSSSFEKAIVAIGHNLMRLNIATKLLKHDIPLATIIHPSAIVSSYTNIGCGSVIFSGSILNIDSQLGISCIINTGATVDHDCFLGHGVHISPGANLAGGVHIGNLSWVGIGASIRQKIIIGENVTIGAGAAVVKNIPNNCLAVGVPAEFRKKI